MGRRGPSTISLLDYRADVCGGPWVRRGRGGGIGEGRTRWGCSDESQRERERKGSGATKRLGCSCVERRAVAIPLQEVNYNSPSFL